MGRRWPVDAKHARTRLVLIRQPLIDQQCVGLLRKHANDVVQVEGGIGRSLDQFLALDVFRHLWNPSFGG